MPSWLALGFQDSSSMSMGEMTCLHDYVMTIMLSVVILIVYIMGFIMLSNKYYKNFSEGTFIETIWSIIPALMLIILVLPSMSVLYMVEDVKNPSFSFKIVAHQWYWTYSVPLFHGLTFYKSSNISNNLTSDSLLSMDSSVSSSPRLMGCTSDMLMPIHHTSRMLITSTDVIHSFSVPSLGLKVDALPGRINQIFSAPSRMGIFFGQCSEICGSNHSFMPISIKVSNMKDFDLIMINKTLDLLLD